MNRGELRQAVFDRLAIRLDGTDSLDPLITNSFVNGAIDQSLAIISTVHDWWWLASTATLTFDTTYGAATLPSDFMKANQMTVNGAPAEQLMLDQYLDPNTTRTSYGWTIYGNQVKIIPIPTQSVQGTLYYFRGEPTLSSDSSTPLMPTVYHYVIVCYAAFLCAARRQDEQRAALYLQEYQSRINAMHMDIRSTVKRKIQFTRLSDYAAWN